MHVDDRVPDHVPVTQSMHTDPDVAPNTEENVPALQLVHEDAATLEDHEPSGQ